MSKALLRPLFFFLFVLVAIVFFVRPGCAATWKPVDPAELALKDNPSLPGSPAMILYRGVEHNDREGSETVYERIKIFKDEGKRYADVQVPYFKEQYDAIESVRGRTIHPDGSAVEFTGQVFEKVFEPRHGQKYQVKTFALPDATPGSILEYQYTIRWEVKMQGPYYGTGYLARNSEWVVQQPLFIKKAHFYFRPAPMDKFAYSVRSVALPPNAHMNRVESDDTVTLDVEDVPPYEEEEYMPPEREVRSRVMFFYGLKDISDPNKFWREETKSWQGRAEDFMARRSAARRQLEAITSDSDSADTKLHKIYDYVQSLNNLSYGITREVKDPNKGIEDVINHKYGHRDDLSRLFVAMAREAGIDATLVRVAGRDSTLFHKEWPYFHQLNLEFVLVRNGGTETYLNPGTYSCPYGTILWEETGAIGVKMDKNPPVFVQIPLPDPSSTQLKTTSKMELDSEGTLTGEVELVLTGQAAIDERIPATTKDAKERKQMMVDLLKGWISSGAEVDLVDVNSWEANTPLVAHFKVSVPNFATTTGRRVVLRNTLMVGAYKNPFVPARRVHPIRMNYTYERIDDFVVKLPKGVEVDSLPKPVADKNGLGELTTQFATENGTLHVTRDFRLDGLFIEPDLYSAVRSYFQKLQVNADAPIVLKTTAAQ